MGNILYGNFYDKYSCNRCEFYPDSKKLKKRCIFCEDTFEKEVMSICHICLQKYKKYNDFGKINYQCSSCFKRHIKYEVQRNNEKDNNIEY